jgi:hypothetical protein
MRISFTGTKIKTLISHRVQKTTYIISHRLSFCRPFDKQRLTTETKNDNHQHI